MVEASQPVNLADHVYEEIRNRILSGEYAAGQPLTELFISKKLDVSRTPVREAMKQLEAEGLIELRPNRAAVVTGIEMQDVEDIYEIRSLLEGRAAEKAAGNATEEEIEKLSEITDLTEFYIERNDIDSISNMDDRFHRMIYDLTKSRILKHILAGLHAYAKSVRESSIRQPGRAEAMLSEHRAILQAITEHDRQKAGRLMEKHIANTTENLEKSHLIE